MKNYRFILKGLDCTNCAKKIEEKIASRKEYKDVVVNFSTETLSLKTDQSEKIQEEIQKIIQEIEPDVKVISKKQKEDIQRNSKDIIRLCIGVLIYLIAIFFQLEGNTKILITSVSAIILLYKTAKKAFRQLKNGTVDENTLIVISVIGACLIGETTEGLMVIVLYEIGKILESRAVHQTRKSISSLMDIKAEYANLKQGEEAIQVPPEKVKVGDIILVKTGERVPLDGCIIEGTAQINNAALTGESKVINVKVGDRVLSGGINNKGLISIKVETLYENSTVNQILNLVENATDKKAKTETMVNKLAKIYTPIVLVLAILVAIFMPILVKNVTYLQSIYKALTFLVIACPCSIAISVPLSYFSGIGKASKRGILIKGSDYLDGLKDVDEMIFDKTGTLTTGKFSVTEIKSFEKQYSDRDILFYFALGEKFSNHPIAKSILKELNQEIDVRKVEEYQEISGKGIAYKIENKKVKIGNQDFAGNKEIKENKIGTHLYLKINEQTVGSITLSDTLKQDVQQTIRKLNELKIVSKMFTGDAKEIATEIGKQVGISQIEYEMLPQMKYEKLEAELHNHQTGKKVAFVGDGINDSPVLARADIGISMGGIGSSSAIEASDIVLMTDELNKIIEAIHISKKTNRIIKENLMFAMTVKLLVFLLSILGIATMWQAVFADVGTTLITICNTIRILK